MHKEVPAPTRRSAMTGLAALCFLSLSACVRSDDENLSETINGNDIKLSTNRVIDQVAVVVMIAPEIYKEHVDMSWIQQKFSEEGISQVVIADVPTHLQGRTTSDALPENSSSQQKDLQAILRSVVDTTIDQENVPTFLLGLGRAAEAAWGLYASGASPVAGAVMVNAPLPSRVTFDGPREAPVLCIYTEHAVANTSSYEPTHLGLQKKEILHEMLTYGQAGDDFMDNSSAGFSSAISDEVMNNALAWIANYRTFAHEH